MTDQHPITPPPELRAKWITEGRCQDYCDTIEHVAARASQWGYEQRSKVNEAELQQARDEELEACCEWLSDMQLAGTGDLELLRTTRRPKPPNLKDLALEAARIELDPEGKNGSLIIRALEALPDD